DAPLRASFDAQKLHKGPLLPRPPTRASSPPTRTHNLGAGQTQVMPVPRARLATRASCSHGDANSRTPNTSPSPFRDFAAQPVLQLNLHSRPVPVSSGLAPTF